MSRHEIPGQSTVGLFGLGTSGISNIQSFIQQSTALQQSMDVALSVKADEIISLENKSKDEVINLDGNDSRTPSPANDRHKRRRSISRSRDRMRERDRDRRRRSRSRSRTPRSRRRPSRERERLKEREYDRERRRKGLPDIRKDHLSGEFHFIFSLISVIIFK